MKLSDLAPNPRNPRKITDDRLRMLKKSLDEFGDLSGIIYNIRTQQMVGGHQRHKVLPEDAEIVIMQSYDPPTRTGTVSEGHILVAGEKFKYRAVDWDETKEKAALIAANKHGGEWEFPILNDLMLELDSENYDLELTGFDNFELENQMTYVKPDSQDELVEKVNHGDENSEWVGMPEFETGGKYINLTFQFKSEIARELYCKENNIEIDKKNAGQWIVYK